MVTLGLENIGCIHKGEVKVGGLTVLTGYNDIGKSTIGKVMFMLVKTAWEAEEKLLNTIQWNIKNRKTQMEFLEERLLRHYENNIEKQTNIKNQISELNEQIAKYEHDLVNISTQHAYAWNMNTFNMKLFRSELQNKESEKNNDPGVIQIESQNIEGKLEINSMQCFFEGNLDPLKDQFADVTYIDSPFILILYKLFQDKRFDADRSQLVPTSILEFPIYRDIVKKIITPLASPFGAEFDPRQIAIRELFLKLSARIQGNIKEYRSDELLYRKTNTDGTHSDFPMVNVASGIKSLGLLGLLMENGYIQPRHLLVIDEPESHLHPQWEVLYGKLLVQLAMENVPIIVSTHSGTLLEAIMRASEKLDAEYLVNYYVGDKTEKGTVFTDVTETKWEAFEKISRANEDMMFNEIEQW
jgi:predicted ATPase